MGVGGHVADADGIVTGGGFLEDGEEVGGEDYVGHVVYCHLQIFVSVSWAGF